jgi:hypothetical protein
MLCGSGDSLADHPRQAIARGGGAGPAATAAPLGIMTRPHPPPRLAPGLTYTHAATRLLKTSAAGLEGQLRVPREV